MLNRNTISNVFKALSDPVRLRMLRLLSVNQTKLCVCEFVDILQIRQYNISKHLKILESSLLTRRTKEGRWVYYDLVVDNDLVANAICKLVAIIPDTEKQFEADQKLCLERMSLREKGRCRIGIQSINLKV
ncbi:MAG: winged helix-turn-helix transcriptional regulator [Flavobacteriaceae bacterium]|nr:winged helix-turn-helix transcriptional regulator [Flavobacteriaceae bacterium]